MPTKPGICGLMLAYFNVDMTLKCLKTLVDQGIETMILVDNSADQQENQRTLALTSHFPKDWLRVIISKENLGFGKGMNLAHSHAQQIGEWDYFLILNNDIEAKPTLVATVREYMQCHPETGMLSAATETAQGIQTEQYYHRWTGLLFSRYVRGSFLCLGGHCLLVRSEAIGKELYNPCYFMYGEDIELNWKLAQQGWKLAVLPQVLLRHEASSSSQNGSYFYEYHINRWHILIVRAVGKNSLERLLMYALRLPLLMLRATMRSWRLRRLTPLKALTNAYYSRVE